MDILTTERNYSLVEKMNCDFYLTSAADGTNIVRVSKCLYKLLYVMYWIKIFEEIIQKAIEYKDNPNKCYMDKILNLLDDDQLFIKKNVSD